MVAAWIRAETGVGPSIASGSQVCRKNWADLPMAPMNSRKPARSSADHWTPRNSQVVPAFVATNGNSSENSIVPYIQKMVMMPSTKPKSPTRLTTKALMAAALAVGFLNQKPISRYEARPTPSQPKNSCMKSAAVTSASIMKVNRDR